MTPATKHKQKSKAQKNLVTNRPVASAQVVEDDQIDQIQIEIQGDDFPSEVDEENTESEPESGKVKPKKSLNDSSW